MKKSDKESDQRKKKYLKVLLNKNEDDLKMCVLGAGHGGLAMAGHISVMGFHVNLYNRSRKKIE